MATAAFEIVSAATRKSQKDPEPLGLVSAATKQSQKTTLLNHLLPKTYDKDDNRLESFNKLGLRTLLYLHHLQTLSKLLESRKVLVKASLQDASDGKPSEDFAAMWEQNIEALKKKSDGCFEDVYQFADDMVRHVSYDEEKGMWDWFHFKIFESEDCMEFDRASVGHMVDLCKNALS
ncbi:MAG: hypothetical protein Q9212_003705 [Teloschistes hypoglaucus]